MNNNLQTFVTEFLAGTWQNPFSKTERVFFQVAAFTIKIVGEEIYLARIRTLERGKGYGSLALDWLVDLADKHGITLIGWIEPFGPWKRLSVAQLQRWYERHSFEVRGREIWRKPINELAHGRELEPVEIDWDGIPF